MKKYNHVVFALILAITLVHAEGKRPNILYFYVDDMGWGAIGPNGQFDRKAKGQAHLVTPTLDRLAAEGVNFRRSYGCTVCSPARSSQQTGFHQGHTFADQNNPDNAMKAIRTDDRTMGDLLSEAGYVTGYWGKWGYGGSKSQPDPEILNVQTLPTSHGYQHVLAELHHVRAHTFFQPTLWKAPAAPGALGGLDLVPNSMERFVGDGSYPKIPSLHDHPDYPKTAYCDDSYAFAALDFVRVQSQNYNATGQPFFGLLAVQVPHAPFAEINQLPEWDEPYGQLPFWDSLSDQAKHWAAMISRIDGHFGNILAALEDPNGDGDNSDSVADNTLVIFQSDNGGPQHPAKEEFDANGGLREVKGRIQEGGIRVPMMIRLPSNFAGNSSLKAGTSSDLVFDVTDFLPTFCELAGVTPPLGIDGVSLAPTLLGTGHQRTREFIIHEAGNGQSIIRDRFKLIRRKGGLELYNLESDHAEEHDLAASKPALVKELETLLLGERVAEPKGFANTYHHWVGGDSESTSDANNWSDYEYANAGIIYTTDDGAPRVSWTARLKNTGETENLAVANTDLEFLALEIKGHSAEQSLILDTEINLTGRNEIRISDNGSLTVNGGTVSSLRWIDIQSGGMLKGTGTIDATVYNSGILSSLNQLQIKSDYYQSANSDLRLTLSGKEGPSLEVNGKAKLAGYLSIRTDSKFKPKKGKTYTLLTAASVIGKFTNKNGTVVSNDGTQFEIAYSKTEVVAIVD
jgi:arylsulfatase A-like enzyme